MTTTRRAFPATWMAIPLCAQYSATRSADAVKLADRSRRTEVSIATAIGNTAFEMKGKEHRTPL